MKFKYFTFILALVSAVSTAQITDYDYERSIENVSEPWHSITIPNDVFGKLNPSLSDIRIYGVNQTNDTIEVPYLLKIQKAEYEKQQHSFEIINSSKNNQGYFYTIKLNKDSVLENILLNFDNSNFDWKVNLEGSNDQTEWFTLLEDYRILDIKNDATDYRFTQLAFSPSNFTYYRVLIKSKSQPYLKGVEVSNQKRVEAKYNRYKIKSKTVTDDKNSKSTIIDVELNQTVPVNYLKIDVAANYDYYRRYRIEYLSDSIKTEKGWSYNYRTLATGYLSSLEKSALEFDAIAQKFKVSIYNADNQPLDMNSLVIKGYQHELIARFTEEADYKLVYGNQSAYRPNYDITNFKNNIPQDLEYLKLGKEEKIEKNEEKGIAALFENEIWLWAIMAIIILLLGGFTYKMLQNSES
ncbi:uncharacterized protein DUF3999 [Nonlabens dokdonensis]|uniref:DUF3999 domain-containing protein n=2 Tax=Nonlabens dokdonensis TaxID=328515 RepID=L7WF67_NONDD|nr:DUF3999 family protein [Nonlabens dokdonensis]AGC78591.1 hypothetical protein DDD_3464 [Nonlabens dokdonensis DSW-6]PZX39279.1 uncharacterized protein DUF3999 [Nonlabens dokdonensis]